MPLTLMPPLAVGGPDPGWERFDRRNRGLGVVTKHPIGEQVVDPGGLMRY